MPELCGAPGKGCQEAAPANWSLYCAVKLNPAETGKLKATPLAPPAALVTEIETTIFDVAAFTVSTASAKE
ncbi:MAG: hypothetical protein DME21_16535 [Verrucomicrobia bacterium]|nr:MAG: hypothetical protein DME21_16535 [Verrucomicrobiota bacterium]